jgi:hypothetical protein
MPSLMLPNSTHFLVNGKSTLVFNSQTLHGVSGELEADYPQLYAVLFNGGKLDESLLLVLNQEQAISGGFLNDRVLNANDTLELILPMSGG